MLALTLACPLAIAFAVPSPGTALAGLSQAPLEQAGPGHGTVVSAVPATGTPDVQDESVDAIFDAGTTVVAGGAFSRVQPHDSDTDIARPNIFAFDKVTGAVDPAFAPVINGEVRSIIGGPTAGTVYVAGAFTAVNGVTRRKVALLNLADGSLVTEFAPPSFNGSINDLALVDDRLLVAGVFTGTGAARGGLASLDATTGALDSYLTVNLTEHHNYDGVSGARGAVGAENIAVSPDGASAVVIGNFKLADGVLHDQVVKLTLGYDAATVAPWNTASYTQRCKYTSYDSYVRDVAYAPDGSYFVIVTAGAKYPDTLCDTAARWENAATGTGLQPTWVTSTGGDTLLSVGISEQAVYVGGHQRWVNNPYGTDAARAGAIARPGIAALDPASGLPLAWNPGRSPRGVGAGEIHVASDGVWVGSDTQWIGPSLHFRERIAFFPVDGGTVPHSTATAVLPGAVYLAGTTDDTLVRRAYDGAKAVTSTSELTDPAGVAWSRVRGAFWVGGTLFYGLDGALHRRAFDGTGLGSANLADPYHDPVWDAVITGSGKKDSTYIGVIPSYHADLSKVTGAFYTEGRLYYTLSTSNKLFWRWFAPDTGAVGAERFSVTGITIANSGGMFLGRGKIYLVNRNSGNLSVRGWFGGAPTGAAKTVSGPGIDGMDWRNVTVFAAPLGG